MYEVRVVAAEEPYPVLAVFYGIDEVWNYIVSGGHRARNGNLLLLMTVEVYRQCREMDEYVARQQDFLGENLKFDGV